MNIKLQLQCGSLAIEAQLRQDAMQSLMDLILSHHTLPQAAPPPYKGPIVAVPHEYVPPPSKPMAAKPKAQVEDDF